MKQSIVSPNAPAALGPYCHATVSGKLVFVSGTLETVLKEAGSSLQHALKATIFLTDLNDFAAVNKIYGDAFQGVYPARSCFQVSKLPGGASVEIELIAELAE